MRSTADLVKAQKNKADSFYTTEDMVEKELSHYTDSLSGKTILCNCNDGDWSAFVAWFLANWRRLQLEKLISVSHTMDGGLLGEHGKLYTWAVPDQPPKIKELEEDGDFRSVECENLLQEADVVCSNPPFSLFRDYVDQLVKHSSKFIIVGTLNAVTYRNVFPLIQKNLIHFGVSVHGGRAFHVPDDYPLEADSCGITEDGRKYIKVTGIRWFTNLNADIPFFEQLELTKTYAGNEASYPKYDGFDAINVDKSIDVPIDYPGVIGVPISFLDKLDPTEFEIVGLSKYVRGEKAGFSVNGESRYVRLLIRRVAPKN